MVFLLLVCWLVGPEEQKDKQQQQNPIFALIAI